MGLNEEFDDRQLQIEAESEPYHPYEYQTENNESWAGALPVKQCVVHVPLLARSRLTWYFAEGCMTQASKKMPVVWASPGKLQLWP